MIEYKQPAIVEELRRRIASEQYSETLPTTAELAKEFDVNIKTMAKAIGQLVNAGLLERRRRCGTRVCRVFPVLSKEPLIEVIFEGFTSIFIHPFWADIWDGMVGMLSAEGFRPVLNMLEADPETGLFKLEKFSMSPSVGKIVLGVFETRVFEEIRKTKIPFIAACDPLDDPTIPQVAFDFTDGIRRAVDYLEHAGYHRIGFVGQTQSLVGTGALHKFNAYLKAVQNYTQINPELLANTRPLAGCGGPALSRMLEKTQPDALIAAYDHQLPELYAVLAEYGLSIPVIGCDGLRLPAIPAERPMIKAPRRECGRAAARQLIMAIRGKHCPRSLRLPAVFCNGDCSY